MAHTFVQETTAFAEYIRNPLDANKPAGIEERRLAIYRDLFFNNINSFVASAFPVFRSLLDDEIWEGLIRDFMVNYRCHTPYFLEISQEFQQYLSTKPDYLTAQQLPDFVSQLVHYEWVELALDVDEIDLCDYELQQNIDPQGDLLEALPRVSPLAWSLAYSYPVHLIGPDHQPSESSPVPTYLIVYRNRTDKVGFMEANAVTARLVQLLNEAASSDNKAASGRDILLQLAAEMQHPVPEQILDSGMAIIEKLAQLDIILGS